MRSFKRENWTRPLPNFKISEPKIRMPIWTRWTKVLTNWQSLPHCPYDSATLSPLLIETKPDGLDPKEERLAAVINAAGVDGTEALRVMRNRSVDAAF